jgi:hypothetical protein
MADWSTISSLATAGGTLVLGIATFAAVRSANRAARIAERSFQIGLRPILAPSRLEDAPQRVMFGDRHWFTLEGGRAVVHVEDGIIYLAMLVRNVGNGMAIIEAWDPQPGMIKGNEGWRPFEEFRLQTRDLWVPPGDVAFWQGALRDETQDIHGAIREAIDGGEVTVDLAYLDHEGGQRTISRFLLIRHEAEDVGSDGEDRHAWMATLTSHHTLEAGSAS